MKNLIEEIIEDCKNLVKQAEDLTQSLTDFNAKFTRINNTEKISDEKEIHKICGKINCDCDEQYEAYRDSQEN